jgi:hypothetical protein
MAKRAYFHGKSELLFVDGIDVNRASKTLLRLVSAPDFKPPIDVGQMMDLFLKSVGYESHHAARVEAKANSLPDAGQPGDK